MTENRYGEIVIGEDAEDIPPGTYAATLVRFELGESAKFGEFRKWFFKLSTGSEVSGATSMFTNPRSKPGRWLAALAGKALAEGETVNVIGKSCLVVIGLKNDWPAVTAVLPPMATTTPAAVSVAPVASQGTPALAELP